MVDPLSRRSLLEIGTVGLAGVALARAASGAPSSDDMTSETEAVIRSWFKLWGESRIWAPFDAWHR
jgi:hypothetical protein